MLKPFLEHMLNTPMFGFCLSILLYEIGVWIQAKTGSPVANPLLIAGVAIIAFLKVTGISYETYNDGGLWSLYTQSRESGFSGRPTLLRHGDTWDLTSGYPVPLSAFFPRRSGWKRRLMEAAEAEIQRQETAGISRYHEGVRRLLRRHFNPQNFYLTAEGLSFFYPMYAIAPAMEGIPVFTLPYGQGGPALPARDA